MCGPSTGAARTSPRHSVLQVLRQRSISTFASTLRQMVANDVPRIEAAVGDLLDAALMKSGSPKCVRILRIG